MLEPLEITPPLYTLEHFSHAACHYSETVQYALILSEAGAPATFWKCINAVPTTQVRVATSRDGETISLTPVRDPLYSETYTADTITFPTYEPIPVSSQRAWKKLQQLSMVYLQSTTAPPHNGFQATYDPND